MSEHCFACHVKKFKRHHRKNKSYIVKYLFYRFLCTKSKNMRQRGRYICKLWKNILLVMQIILNKKYNNWKSMKNSWNHILHPPPPTLLPFDLKNKKRVNFLPVLTVSCNFHNKIQLKNIAETSILHDIQ